MNNPDCYCITRKEYEVACSIATLKYEPELVGAPAISLKRGSTSIDCAEAPMAKKVAKPSPGETKVGFANANTVHTKSPAAASEVVLKHLQVQASPYFYYTDHGQEVNNNPHPLNQAAHPPISPLEMHALHNSISRYHPGRSFGIQQRFECTHTHTLPTDNKGSKPAALTYPNEHVRISRSFPSNYSEVQHPKVPAAVISMYEAVSPKEYEAAVKNAMSNVLKIGEMHQYPTINIASKFFKEVMSSMIFQALQKYHGHQNDDEASSDVESNQKAYQASPDNPNGEFTVLDFQKQNPSPQNKWDGAVTYQGPLTKSHASLFYKV
jgi:hypothetical protein